MSDNIVLFHKSFMTVPKGKSQTRYMYCLSKLTRDIWIFNDLLLSLRQSS